MKIKRYIQTEIIQRRLSQSGVLVVYDAHDRYRDLCLELADDNTTVVDASQGSILSREMAIQTLQQMGESPADGRLLVYVPTAPPASNQQKMVDPFWVYGEIGSYFPHKTADEFEQICLTAKSDHATEIRKVFTENTYPSFELIDNIGGGLGWPTLQAVLGVESTLEIILGFMVPTPAQQQKLGGNQPWVPEAKELLKRNLGLELHTKQTSWQPISDELWRFVLFSEFVFDMPTGSEIPGSLKSIPTAIEQAQSLVFEICHKLRSNLDSQASYIEHAQEIENALELPTRCKLITDLGDRDTFPFEERSFFLQCVTAIKSDDLDSAKAIIGRNKGSIWIGRGESQAQWNIVETIVRLVEKCGDCGSQLPSQANSQERLIFFYIDQFYKVDQFHREFEHAVGDHIDLTGALTPAIDFARKKYSDLANQVQLLFIKHLEETGWPPSGMLSSAEIFDKLVAPNLKEAGRRVAYFMIDALRYELGAELEKELVEEGNTELNAAFSIIPTVTPIGMTSLLPNAHSKLGLKRSTDGELVVMMGDTSINNVGHRMKWIESLYGQRFHQAKLEEVIKPTFFKKLGDHVELLVVRSSSVDARMETEYQSGLPAIKKDMQAIRVALHRLRDAGFMHVVIATDHGFCINPLPDAGDTCKPPSGDWKKLHDRCVIGKGAPDTNNWVCASNHIGLKGDFEQVGGPKTFACYSANNQYFHGGASLQEAVVPCIVVNLKKTTDEIKNITYSIRYKRDATKITTQLPVFELKAVAGDLFEQTEARDVLLQAVDKNGKVIGEPKPGGVVNPASGTISLYLGQAVKIPIKMPPADEFEGMFKVQLLDPGTLALLAELKLETDYMM